MAEEAQYPSGGDSATNKRKYANQSDTPALPSFGGRRTTGFSSGPISSQSPDSAPSYNSVAPPADDIQIAKQKAQEIAARLLNSVEAKRPRVENGGYDYTDTKGFNSGPTDFVQKPIMSAVAASYGYPGPSKKIEIPNGRVGVIIGKSGETIRYLQLQSGAKIQVTRDFDADLNAPTREVELKGNPDQIAKAEQLISDVLNESESGGSGIVSRRITERQGMVEQFVMKVSNNKVGIIIGKGGDTIKSMQSSTGARIQVIPLHLPPGDTSMERTVQIDGSSEQIEAAKLLVNEVISENRVRNQAMTGYSHQGYQARPPTGWAPPGLQMQQPGYGYIQPGAYAGGPGQTPQYNMTQPLYAGYPPQPTSVGYATGWDQTPSTTNQQTAQGGGYDYYSQQSAPQQQQAPGSALGPADNASYGYQQPASSYIQQGQGYTQDSYGGSHASAPQPGYGQPQPGYDQQYGYNSTSGYGNVANPTPEGQTPSYGAQGDGNQAPQSTTAIQHGHNASQQRSPNPSYPPQGPTQPGYGVLPTSQTGYGTQPPSGYAPNYGTPQTQKPAAGQLQQSPTAQGGYVQAAPVQPGYPHSQPPPAQTGYAQPDSGTQRAPPSGYGAGQTVGYAPPAYGAPSAAQLSYGGQQPPPYNSAYGSGYSQPAAYSADGNAGPTSQAVQPSGIAKASPKS